MILIKDEIAGIHHEPQIEICSYLLVQIFFPSFLCVFKDDLRTAHGMDILEYKRMLRRISRMMIKKKHLALIKIFLVFRKWRYTQIGRHIHEDQEIICFVIEFRHDLLDAWKESENPARFGWCEI